MQNPLDVSLYEPQRVLCWNPLLRTDKVTEKFGLSILVAAHRSPQLVDNPTIRTDFRNTLLVGYHSVRRLPPPELIRLLVPVYKDMLKLEATCRNPKQAAQASCSHLLGMMEKLGTDYDRFFFEHLNQILDHQSGLSRIEPNARDLAVSNR